MYCFIFLSKKFLTRLLNWLMIHIKPFKYFITPTLQLPLINDNKAVNKTVINKAVKMH